MTIEQDENITKLYNRFSKSLIRLLALSCALSDESEDYPKGMSKKLIRDISKHNEKLRSVVRELINIRDEIGSYRNE